MPYCGKKRLILAQMLLGLLIVCVGHFSQAREIITLKEAEHIAVTHAPEIKKLLANSQALSEKAITDGQLPDPKLMLGTENLPSDSFSFTQDDMTMISLGLQQSFPPGQSLKIKSQQTKHLATAEQKKIELQKLIILKNLREAWLDFYYWAKTISLLEEGQILIDRLLKIAEIQYSLNKGSQTDILQAQLEVSRYKNQLLQAKQNLAITQVQLKRRLGKNDSDLIFEVRLPSWPHPSVLNALAKILPTHPLLAVDEATIAAARSEIAWAKEQYKPGLMLDVGYGLRQGSMVDGTRRSNFVAANLTIDLPFFRRNRQDRQLSTSLYQLEGAQFEQETHLKDLQQELAIQYAAWEGLSQRKNLLQQRLIPEAIQSSKIAFLQYQNTTADFSTVLKARNNELAAQLEYLQIQVEEAKARVGLLYLEGTCE